MVAVGELAAVDVIVLGVLALAFAFALASLARGLAELIRPALPGPLAGIANAIITGAGIAEKALGGWINAGISGAQNIIGVSAHAAVALFNAYANWQLSQLAFASRLIHTTIPSAIATAEATAHQLVAAVVAYIDARAAALIAGLIQLQAVVEAEMAVLRAQLVALTATAYQQAVGFALHLFAVAEARAQALFVQAEQDIAAAQATERAFAVAVGASAAAYTDRVAVEVAQYAAAGVFGAETYARGLAGDLEQLIESDRAKAFAYASALVIPLAGALEELQRLKCIQNCEPLGALGELFNDIDLALLLGLAGYALTDPKGAQKFISDEVLPQFDGLVDVGRQLVEAI